MCGKGIKPDALHSIIDELDKTLALNTQNEILTCILLMHSQNDVLKPDDSVNPSEIMRWHFD